MCVCLHLGIRPQGGRTVQLLEPLLDVAFSHKLELGLFWPLGICIDLPILARTQLQSMSVILYIFLFRGQDSCLAFACILFSMLCRLLALFDA